MIRGIARSPAAVLPVLLFASALLAQTAPAAKDYAIKLHRPLKVGQKFAFSASGTTKGCMAQTLDGKTRKQEEEHSAELVGVEEILAVDEKGGVTKVAITVEKCVKIEGEAKTEAIPKGKTVIGQKVNGKKEWRVKDDPDPLSRDAVDVLELLVTLKAATEATDDDVFGTTARQKVGDSWPVNAEAAAKDLKRLAPDLDKSDISGQVKLRGLMTVGGVECLEVTAELAVKNVAPPGLPAGVKAEKAEMKAELTIALPTDPSLPRLREAGAMTFVSVLKGKVGQEAKDMTVEITKETRTKTETTPVKVEK
jgi:hypothetical protein